MLMDTYTWKASVYEFFFFIGEDEQKYSWLYKECVVECTGRMLNYGAHSDVFEVQYKGNVYAAKRCSISGSCVEGVCKTLTSVRHHNLVLYYGICQLATDNSMVIIMPRMDIDLNAYLEKNPYISVKEKLSVMYDVANGLNHLHSQKPVIIHGDLNASNVLLNWSNKVAKISDFGNSLILKASCESTTLYHGTLRYKSPEIMSGCEYDEKVDIFSYGHLAVHIVIQHQPQNLEPVKYRKSSQLFARTEIERRQVSLDEVKEKLHGGDNHPLYMIMTSCLQDEPNLRPSCKDVLRNLSRTNDVATNVRGEVSESVYPTLSPRILQKGMVWTYNYYQRVGRLSIRELVDSLCRDDTDVPIA